MGSRCSPTTLVEIFAGQKEATKLVSARDFVNLKQENVDFGFFCVVLLISEVIFKDLSSFCE